MKNVEDVISLLQAIKQFRVNDELPFNTVDYMQIDSAIEFLVTLQNIETIALKMALAIREWNAAKVERESWKPIVGQIPPVGILGSAKKANAMLSEALEEYHVYMRDRVR